ncbi:hypothetical protein [Hymenobacter weizhouensis]|uniref:hypothetical protein n=1 Tax=Hymenobacter sp. YIM 151500-1 TaxID=2987689 RepID=UPI0022264A1D|nr:hypothetical protein [Hymenobacter sp. YIM 151500-1]UYZ64251.1 hypothetical protein OIS53_05230 [Hymenobacter sp. YIM 151500-1]
MPPPSPAQALYWCFGAWRYRVAEFQYRLYQALDAARRRSTQTRADHVRFSLLDADAHSAVVAYAACSYQRAHSVFELECQDGSCRPWLTVQAAHLTSFVEELRPGPGQEPSHRQRLALSAAALVLRDGTTIQRHTVIPWDAPPEVERRARLEGWSRPQAAAMPAPYPELKVSAPAKTGPPALSGNQEKSIYGEHRSDAFMRAQGHTKLNDGGHLTPLPPHPSRGQGIDGVWRHASPPPDYIITEAKYNKSRLGYTKGSGRQMSDQWIISDNRLERAVGRPEALRIAAALRRPGRVEKRLHNVAPDGTLTETILT